MYTALTEHHQTGTIAVTSKPAPENSPPHLLAQELNNEACSMIVREDNLPDAIQLLTTALKLSKACLRKQDNVTNTRLPETCDTCICLYQQDIEDHTFSLPDRRCEDGVRPARKRSRAKFDRGLPKKPTPSKTPSNLEDEKGAFICKVPLCVHPTCIEKHYDVGAILSTTILFNLALAHQLLAMSIPENTTTEGCFSSATRRMVFNKALKLYELSVLALYDSGCSDATSLRLNMLVSNNLGEIHRRVGSPKKHHMCLEYLLRSMMFLAHGREGGMTCHDDHRLVTRDEIDGFYRNIQSFSTLLGDHVHAGAA